MSELKCPFCQQELREIYCYGVVMGYLCPNPDCKKAEKLKGNAEFWQKLIRTRKALDVAVDALKSAHDYYEYCIQRDKDYDGDDINWDCTAMNMDNDISEALKQITALEQKD